MTNIVQRRMLYINRITSRLGMYDLLRTAIYLAKGISVSGTVIIVLFYNIGSLTYNTLLSKIKIKPRTALQISTIMKFTFYATIAFSNNLWMFCILSFLQGVSDTISNIVTDSYCYQINKDSHSKVMAEIISSATLITIILNLVASATFQISWWIPLGIMMLSQVITFVTGFYLPDIEDSNNDHIICNKFSLKEEISQFKKDLDSKQLRNIVYLLLCFKIYIIILIRVKPYMLRAMPFSISVLGYIDTFAQVGAIVASKIPKKYLKLDNMLVISNSVAIMLVILSVFINPVVLAPFLLLTPVAFMLIVPAISQEIGDMTAGMSHMNRVLCKVDMVNNVVVLLVLIFMTTMYKTMPFYVGYLIALPFIFIAMKLTYNLAKDGEEEENSSVKHAVNI